MNQTNRTNELRIAVLANDERAIAELYHWIRKRVFENISKRFPNVSEHDKEEAFHEAFLTVINMIRENAARLEKGEDKVDILINAVGMIIKIIYFMLLKLYRKSKERYVDSDEFDFHDYEASEELRGNPELAKEAFQTLGSNCNTLVSLKLIHGMSYKVISEIRAEETGRQTTTGQLRVEYHRCLNKLRRIYNELIKKPPKK